MLPQNIRLSALTITVIQSLWNLRSNSLIRISAPPLIRQQLEPQSEEATEERRGETTPSLDLNRTQEPIATLQRRMAESLNVLSTVTRSLIRPSLAGEALGSLTMEREAASGGKVLTRISSVSPDFSAAEVSVASSQPENKNVREGKLNGDGKINEFAPNQKTPHPPPTDPHVNQEIMVPPPLHVELGLQSQETPRKDALREGVVESWLHQQEEAGVRPIMTFAEAHQLFQELFVEYVDSGVIPSEIFSTQFLETQASLGLESARTDLRLRLAQILRPEKSREELKGSPLRKSTIPPILLPSYLLATLWGRGSLYFGLTTKPVPTPATQPHSNPPEPASLPAVPPTLQTHKPSAEGRLLTTRDDTIKSPEVFENRDPASTLSPENAPARETLAATARSSRIETIEAMEAAPKEGTSRMANLYAPIPSLLLPSFLSAAFQEKSSSALEPIPSASTSPDLVFRTASTAEEARRLAGASNLSELNAIDEGTRQAFTGSGDVPLNVDARRKGLVSSQGAPSETGSRDLKASSSSLPFERRDIHFPQTYSLTETLYSKMFAHATGATTPPSLSTVTLPLTSPPRTASRVERELSSTEPSHSRDQMVTKRDQGSTGSDFSNISEYRPIPVHVRPPVVLAAQESRTLQRTMQLPFPSANMSPTRQMSVFSPEVKADHEGPEANNAKRSYPETGSSLASDEESALHEQVKKIGRLLAEEVKRHIGSS